MVKWWKCECDAFIHLKWINFFFLVLFTNKICSLHAKRIEMKWIQFRIVIRVNTRRTSKLKWTTLQKGHTGHKWSDFISGCIGSRPARLRLSNRKRERERAISRVFGLFNIKRIKSYANSCVVELSNGMVDI